MRAIKFFWFFLIGVLIMEVLIPYPAPNYKDKDLMVKEIVNGSFAKAIFKDIGRYRYALSRYDTDLADILIDKAAKEPLTPADVSLDMENFDLSKIKEWAWLPFYVEAGSKKLEKVYDPRDYYDTYAYKNENKIVGSYSNGSLDNLYLSYPYYDKRNAGIVGFNKDNNGIKTEVWFFDLKDYSLKKLGDIPSDLLDKYAQIISYIKGAVIVRFTIDWNSNNFTYISFGLDGSINRANNLGNKYVTFGDYGELAIQSVDKKKTYIYNNKLELIQTLNGDYVTSYVAIGSNLTPYPFGTKIKKTFYYIKSETQSYKWKRTKDGWTISIKNKPLWKYNKMHLYDYSTDGFINKPLKFMNYNYIRNGAIAPKVRLPKGNNISEYRYEQAGNYGDFLIVKYNDGSKKLFHTFDFRNWEECQTIAGGYNIMGRIWIESRSDGVVGLDPRSVIVNGYGGNIYFKFEGYELRRVK